ncbi:MAG: hypothetical protein ACK5ME_08650 [Parahaliea sp.]
MKRRFSYKPFRRRAATAAVLVYGLSGLHADANETPVNLAASTITPIPATSITRLSPDNAMPVSNAGGGSTQQQAPVYVDKLIESPAPDNTSSQYWTDPPASSTSTIFQSIRAASYYRNNSDTGDSLDSGLEYVAIAGTNNFGELQLKLVALNEDDGQLYYRNGAGKNDNHNVRQTGLRRYTLQQTGLPLTENLSMDNILGTHRQSRNTIFSRRISLINQRFGASEPDIEGLTTRLYSTQNGLSLSSGRLGESYGSVMPGFIKKKGRINRAQAHRLNERYSLSLDVWKSSDNPDKNNNRSGTRLNWQAAWDNELESVLTLATSDNSVATLIGASQKRPSGFSHDGGLYYFEPRFIWIDTQIGNDYAGAYYRFQHRYRTLYYSAAFEYRRDGMEDNILPERDTFYANFNSNYRLNHRDQISLAYSLRDIDARESNAPDNASYSEHALWSSYSRQHTRSVRSSVGANLRTRKGSNYQRLSYDIHYDLNEGDTLQLGLEYNRDHNEGGNSNSYFADASWHTVFTGWGSLALGSSYGFNDNRNSQNNNWSAYLSYELAIGSRWSFSAQADYNRTDYDLDSQYNLADELFSDNPFFEDRHFNNRQFSLRLNLGYAFGGGQGSGILAATGRSRGAGTIRGRLFLDANNDGLAQDNEKGLAGITVYLDSIYPVTTDARGEFSYPSVGPGEHYIFVDETRLPLPWGLRGSEYTPLRVSLRSTSQVDIPVSRL